MNQWLNEAAIVLVYWNKQEVWGGVEGGGRIEEH